MWSYRTPRRDHANRQRGRIGITNLEVTPADVGGGRVGNTVAKCGLMCMHEWANKLR